MKKLLVIFVVVLFSSAMFAQDVLQQFMYTDDFLLTTPLYLEDGVTPIPDGTVINVVLGGTYDEANPFTLNNNFHEDTFNGGGFGIGEGFFLTVAYFNWEDPVGSPEEPCANCSEDVYLRIAHPTCGYRYSEIITGPAPGSGTSELEVGTWEAWDFTPCGDPTNVTLTAFQAAFTGEFAAITWVTASEADMQEFKIYRNDVKIYSVDATNTSQTATYTFEDIYVESGETYVYTLEGVNLDGTTQNLGSRTLTIEIDPIYNGGTDVKGFFPNPVRRGGDQELLYSLNTGETLNLTVYNAKGQVVNTQEITQAGENQAVKLNTNYASGIYFYKIEGNSISDVKKMLILK